MQVSQQLAVMQVVQIKTVVHLLIDKVANNNKFLLLNVINKSNEYKQMTRMLFEFKENIFIDFVN